MNKLNYTTKDRLERLYSGKPIDRVPFMALPSLFSGSFSKLSSHEYFLNPNTSYESQVKTIEYLGSDDSPGFDLPGWIGWDFGSDLYFSEEIGIKVPYCKSKPVESLSDAYNLKAPNLETAQGFRKRLEFYELAIRDGHSVSLPAGSPTEILAHLVDTSLLLRWYAKEKEAIHHMLSVVTAYIMEMEDFYIKYFGIENCSAYSSYPFDSNSIISPRVFETISLPYILEIHSHLFDVGVKSFSIHLCGNHRLNLPYFEKMHLPTKSTISVDESMDMSDMSNFWGPNYVLMGNVPTSLLLSRTYESVYEYCKQLLTSYKNRDGGFILSPSCDLPPDTPIDNLFAMKKAVEDYGVF